MDNRCEITGLSIFQKEEWKEIEFGEKFYVSFQILGGKMLLTKSRGNLRNFDVDGFYLFRKKLVEAQFPDGIEFIELFDYWMTVGSLSRYSRKRLIYNLIHDRTGCRGLVLYNIGGFVKMFLGFGIAIFRKDFKYPVRITGSLKDAYDLAIHWRENEKISFVDELSFLGIEKVDKWTRSNVGAENHVEIRAGKVPGVGYLIYSRYSGYLSIELTKEIVNILRNILESGHIKGDFIRIADYKDVTGMDLKYRNTFFSAIRLLNQQYQCNDVTTFIYGANKIIRTIINLGKRILDQRIIFIDNLEDVFNKIRNSEPYKSKERVVWIKEKDIEHVVSTMGKILWEDSREMEGLSPQSPLKVIEDSIELVKYDFDELSLTIKEKNNQMLSLIQDLELTRDEALAAAQAKSQFLSNMSHEIRTPINGVMSMTQLLEMTNLTVKQREYLGNIRTATQSLLRMVDDILDYSKLKSGRIDIHSEKFSFADCLDKCIGFHLSDANKKNIRLHYKNEMDAGILLWGDSQKIFHVLDNLIGNAVKFTEKGSVFVYVTYKQVQENKLQIITSVKDTGVGIPKEKHAIIFENFNLIEDTYTRKHAGMGLGLAFCKNFIEAMGGRFWFESIEGIGSEFSFMVELIEVSQQDVNRELPHHAML